MLEWIIMVLVGVVASVYGSLVGLGGGIIIVPVLLLLGQNLTGHIIPEATAVGTSLAVLIVTALASTLSYMKRKRVDFKSAWLLFITSGPGAMVGSALTSRFHGGWFQISFGAFMLLMALLLIFRDRLKPVTRQWPIQRTMTDSDGGSYTYGYGAATLLSIGFFVGLVSGLFGIGGGSLFVPAMVILFRFPPHVATATSMFVIFLSAILGSSVHAAMGEVEWLLFAALAPGAWVGGKLGAYLAMRMKGGTILWVLRITLLLLAGRLLIGGIQQL
ncbi:sulfite exporter TauE/SafE family protein [Paenibacillus beijingensis]|uniref:Probable membrane transporter protein n=1 Tax=Paenibacillus beijingensis TaxID=1126833 RepID=A0A0D5NHJ4_9BACL|nr:sulfite exporter TauE/SafE family protein [Paenibacillus beijingensis]AJY74388.1 membrane protein [Paenibacillus beijingensis]